MTKQYVRWPTAQVFGANVPLVVAGIVLLYVPYSKSEKSLDLFSQWLQLAYSFTR